MAEIDEESGAYSVKPYSTRMYLHRGDGEIRLDGMPLEWFGGEFSILSAAERRERIAEWEDKGPEA